MKAKHETVNVTAKANTHGLTDLSMTASGKMAKKTGTENKAIRTVAVMTEDGKMIKWTALAF